MRFILWFSALVSLIWTLRGERIQGKSLFSVDLIDPALPLPLSTYVIKRKRSKGQRRRLRSSLLAPLYPGYGTHYVFAYIGTPPQRQSLILDTGSSFTALPCIGCNNCGEHTDKYFNLSDSSTSQIPKCLHNQNCMVSHSYNEGSTWHGFKVIDKLWLGDSEADAIPQAPNFRTEFSFACQTTMTGLFKSQLADGLLGLADTEDTLPWQLQKKNITGTRIFALCFRIGGGILTLGGVDQLLHSKKISYVKLDKRSNGGYGVHIQYVAFREVKDSLNHSIAALPSVYSGSKGAIIDSGSTDTYLPVSIANSFQQQFKKITGLLYSTESFQLSEEMLKKLPEIVFGLVGVNKEIVEIVIPVSGYVDSLGDGKYSFRIFLSDATGSVLGANFITGYNVIFDSENSRLGFARSSCNYEELVPQATKNPTFQPTSPDKGEPHCDSKKLIPYTSCSAYCSKNESSYRSTGTQDFMNECKDGNIITRLCYENCSFHRISRGPVPCFDQPWSDCTHGCVKSRLVVPTDEDILVNGKCNYKYQTVTCYSGLCPRNDGDYLVYLDMRVRIEPYRWSYVHSEYFYLALSQVLKIYMHNIELLHNAGNEYASASKLHFQIRVKAKDFASTLALHDAAQKIVAKLRRTDFPQLLLNELIFRSSLVDGDAINRFGWLFPSDVEVLSAVGIPIGDKRDPFGLTEDPKRSNVDNYAPAINTFGYFVLGIAIAAIVVVIILLYLHFRLRQEYALLAKDKSSITKSSETLRKLWSKFANFASRGFHKERQLSQTQAEKEQQLSRMNLMKSESEDSDDQD